MPEVSNITVIKFLKTGEISIRICILSGIVEAGYASSKNDFVALLFVYNDLLKEAANRNMRDKTMEELYHFFCEKGGRVLKCKEYFEKNQVIAEAYRFISGVIQYIKGQNNNPKHKWYLKI